MKLLIDITLGDDAMQTLADVTFAVGRAFTDAASRGLPLLQPLPEGAEGTISDTNGNTVGRWHVAGDAAEAWVT